MQNGWAFVFGCCMGSFLQVIMDRFLKDKSWLIGRSCCMSCQKKLKWFMMIPVISWILLKGKCLYCGSKIPIRCLFTELLFGLAAFFCFFTEGMEGILKFLVICILFLISYFDMKTMIIESVWFYLLALIVVIHLMVQGNLKEAVIGSLAVSSIMTLLNILIPASFGSGDIILMALCGALLGKERIFESWIVANICAGIQAFYLLIKKKANRKSHIPYAPALCTGIVFVLMKNRIYF